MSAIAVIGAGYLGKELAIQLQREDQEVIATTRSLEKKEALSATLRDVRILHGNHPDSWKSILQECRALVLCMAPDRSDQYKECYLETAQTLHSLLSHSPHIEHLVYTGSTSVYGEHFGKVVTEETEIVPDTPSSKILAETEKELLTLQTSRRTVCIFRLGELYGPGRTIADRLRALNGRPLPGTGANICNLIHKDEAVYALMFSLKNRLNGIYNLVNSQHPTRKELYHTLCMKEGVPPVQWDPSLHSVHGGNKQVSNAKLLEQIKFCFYSEGPETCSLL